MLSKARKWASISVGAPLLGNMDGRFFLRSFLLEEFLSGLLEICKCPVDEYLSPQGPRCGTWRGFVCGDFREKRSNIFGFLSWTQKLLRFYVWEKEKKF